jgi:hypothetical protein
VHACGAAPSGQAVNGVGAPNFGVNIACHWCRSGAVNTCNVDCNCSGAAWEINGVRCWGVSLNGCTQDNAFSQTVCPRHPSSPGCASGMYWGDGNAYGRAGDCGVVTNGSINWGMVLPNGNILSYYRLYNPGSLSDFNAGITGDGETGWMTDEDGFPIPDCYQRLGFWYCCDGCNYGQSDCCESPWYSSNQCKELVLRCLPGNANSYINIDNLTAFTPTAEEMGYRCGCSDPDATMVFVNVNDTQTVIDGIEPTEEDCINQEINDTYYEGELMVTCVKEDCYSLEDDWVEPSYESSGIWKHNVRCDLFNNYYNIQYPWEVELIESIGQEVNTIRSIEYQLEAYEYKPQYDDEGCMINYGCDDRWHDLMYNFDEAIVYNSEQNSGLLTLVEQTPDVNDIVSYPIIGDEDIQILFKKVEQKYRFDQFWDNTANRNVSEPMFITQLNGYIRDLNDAYLNYDKPQLERKKFRHYANNLILRKKVIYQEQISDMMIAYPDGKNHTRKMILKLVNTKINLSHR